MFPLERHLLTSWPLTNWAETRQLVAVSGGADSMALLRALLATAPVHGLIDAAHFNHRWRGDESDRDAAFVASECDRLGIRLHLGEATSRSEAERTEASARRARYDFLVHTAYRTGARYVLTAHTASDCVETVLHNLFRGTGLGGVGGIPQTRPLDAELVLVRPLVRCTRQQVIAYLQELGQGFREDTSNADTSYRRNWIRHALLPEIRTAYGPGTEERLLSFSELAAEAQTAFRELATEYLANVDRLPGKEDLDPAWISLPTHTCLPVPWPVAREALAMLWTARRWPLQAMSRSHWEGMRRLWRGETGAPLPLPGQVVARRERERIVARRLEG